MRVLKDSIMHWSVKINCQSCYSNLEIFESDLSIERVEVLGGDANRLCIQCSVCHRVQSVESIVPPYFKQKIRQGDK